jgi:hypothetical protein
LLTSAPEKILKPGAKMPGRRQAHSFISLPPSITHSK